MYDGKSDALDDANACFHGYLCLVVYTANCLRPFSQCTPVLFFVILFLCVNRCVVTVGGVRVICCCWFYVYFYSVDWAGGLNGPYGRDTVSEMASDDQLY